MTVLLTRLVKQPQDAVIFSIQRAHCSHCCYVSVVVERPSELRPLSVTVFVKRTKAACYQAALLICHCLLLSPVCSWPVWANSAATPNTVDLNRPHIQGKQTKMLSYSLLDPLSSVCFEGKSHFSASQDLSLARSKYFKLPETESRGGVRSIKPPDFSLKLYRSVSVPQRKERKANVNPQRREAKRKTQIMLPCVLHESNRRKETPKFIVSYRPPDAGESELMFVKTGKYLSEPYKNPKPHNFRPVIIHTSRSSQKRVSTKSWSWCGCYVQFKHKVVINTKQQTRGGFNIHLFASDCLFQLDENLPDIVTTYERDPGNMNLKVKHLDTCKWIHLILFHSLSVTLGWNLEEPSSAFTETHAYCSRKE